MNEVLDEALLSVFTVPANDAHPSTIADRLMRLPELAHLAEHEVSFLWLLRNTEQVQGGRRVIGMVHEPQVQGRLRDLFTQMLVQTYGFMPDFVITLDADFWADATPLQREALVHHELSHVKQANDKFGDPRVNKQTGEPVFELVAHDLEEFNATVKRYGAWKGDVAAFLDAAKG